MSEDTEIQNVETRALEPEFLTETKFDDFDIPVEVLAGLDDAGFKKCTPIQAEVLPTALEGKDVAGQAQTGTGKTAAFLVTIFTRLIRSQNKRSGMPRALVVAPTRELALQVYEDAQLLGRHTKLTLAVAFGGIDYRQQADAIRKGPDVIICTPGRIIDYLKQGIFKAGQIECLVIDEADRLFDLGFIKDLRFLLRRLPHYEKRQSMLFSATLSYRVLELTYDFMNMPEFISVTPKELTVEGVEQSLYHVGLEDKLSLLLGILEKEEWNRVLIFVNTKAGVEWLAKKLKGNGLPAEGITGDLPQPRRLKLMEQFKDDRLKILVATDVASRGIHIEDISHVVNYDLPQDAENYIHRIGRTARAGRTGRAISFACENYVFHLEPIEELLGHKIPVLWPEEGLLKKDVAGAVWVDRPRPARKPARTPVRTRKERGRVEEPGRKPSKKYPSSSRPGGIFGLKPGAPKTEEPAEEEPKKKKRRRRRRKKPAAAAAAAGGKPD